MSLKIIVAVLCVILAARLGASNASTHNDFTKQQQNLTASLLAGYNSDIRPEQTVIGEFYFILEQLIDVNEVNQIMTTSINVYMWWNGKILINLS
jgi:hypothetical protein